MNKKQLDVIPRRITQTPPKKGMTWAQWQLEAIENLSELNIRNPHAGTIMLKLAAKLRAGSGGVVIASRNTLAEMMGVSVPTVARAIKLLIDENWVRRVRLGSATAFAINHEIAWVGAEGDKKFAEFAAIAIASRSEQDERDLAPGMPKPVPVLDANERLIPVGEGADPPSQKILDGLEPVIYRDPETGQHWTKDGEAWHLEDESS